MARHDPPAFDPAAPPLKSEQTGVPRSAQISFGNDDPMERMTDEERIAVRRGLDDWRSNRLATAEDIQTVFRLLGR